MRSNVHVAAAKDGRADVAGDADPATGYRVRLVGGGRDVVRRHERRGSTLGGTRGTHQSASRAASASPPLGFINARLYALPASAGAFHDILEGTNDLEKLGKYAAGPGWDACTGLGSPNGARLLEALED